MGKNSRSSQMQEIGQHVRFIHARRAPMRVFWSTPNPEDTFGKEIIGAIKVTDGNAVIRDTKMMGRPDMAAVTWRLVRRMERRRRLLLVI